MSRRRHALALARRFRTCPTSAFPGPAASDPRMAAHRSRCPLCAELGAQDPWQSIARRVGALADGTATAGSRAPAPGDLVAVKAELARWVGDLFYHPPLVVVLSACPRVPDAVQVAQVYHDLLLAGPGDLIIQRPDSPLGPFFIQCWNRYTLRCRDLGAPLFKLADRVVAAALDRDSQEVPPWAPLPVPWQGGDDPRRAFRRMEVEVANGFRAEAMETVMAASGPPLASAGQVRADFKRLVPGVGWRTRCTDAEELLVTAQMPDDFYPLAAADEGTTLFGRRIDLAKGRPVRIFPFLARADHTAVLTESVTGVAGRIEAVPPDREGQSRLLAAFAIPGQLSIPCRTVDWDPGSGSFYIEVPVADMGPVRIEITLIVERCDD